MLKSKTEHFYIVCILFALSVKQVVCVKILLTKYYFTKQLLTCIMPVKTK
jgi:hypothetical protein